MGVVIRTAFNNQGWSNRCRNVLSNWRSFLKCKEKVLGTGFQLDQDGDCISSFCWEQTLCTQYWWENNPGNFNRWKAKGKVFFVYPAPDNSLVLWGKSEVDRIAGNRIYFKPFNPLPAERRVRGLRWRNITGKVFGQGTYRYIDSRLESDFENLIEGK